MSCHYNEFNVFAIFPFINMYVLEYILDEINNELLSHFFCLTKFELNCFSYVSYAIVKIVILMHDITIKYLLSCNIIVLLSKTQLLYDECILHYIHHNINSIP